jgi:hypothetical protein
MLTSNPVTNAASNKGAETIKVTSIAFWPSVITLSGVMVLFHHFVRWINMLHPQ